jgi:hypothetical protein
VVSLPENDRESDGTSSPCAKKQDAAVQSAHDTVVNNASEAACVALRLPKNFLKGMAATIAGLAVEGWSRATLKRWIEGYFKNHAGKPPPAKKIDAYLEHVLAAHEKRNDKLPDGAWLGDLETNVVLMARDLEPQWKMRDRIVSHFKSRNAEPPPQQQIEDYLWKLRQGIVHNIYGDTNSESVTDNEPVPITCNKSLLAVSEFVTQETQETQRTSPNSSEFFRKTTNARVGVLGEESNSKKTYKSECLKGTPSTLPFGIYIGEAIDDINVHLHANVSNGNVSRKDGWQSNLFTFLRMVKAHSDMGNKSGAQAFGAVEQQLKTFTNCPKTVCPWKFYLGVSREDAQVEFLDAWDKVRYLAGLNPLNVAIERAKRVPLGLNQGKVRSFTAGYQDFVSIAGWLQTAMGNKPILLPVHQLAERLGVVAMTISRYRQWAIEDGYLRQTGKGQWVTTGRGRADEFRFDVSRFKLLMETSAEGCAESFEQASKQRALA